MKKFLFFTLLCLVIGLAANAKVSKTKANKASKAQISYKVEKAYQVFQGDNSVTPGDVINASTVVEIKDNGYLLFVDNTAKKRYYVSRTCKAKMQDITSEAKKPKSVSKSMLESMMTKSKKYGYSSSGNVERKPTLEYIDVETDENGDIKVYMIE